MDPRVAQELKGHFVALSLSQFGCHVVQRVSQEGECLSNGFNLLNVPQILDEQALRADVVEELLTDQVFETLTCRNSIHVVSYNGVLLRSASLIACLLSSQWQKVLEVSNPREYSK